MMRILMTSDHSMEISGVRAQMHFHATREYVVPDELAESLIEAGKARLFDADVESQIDLDAAEASGRQARIARIKRELAEAEEGYIARHNRQRRAIIALRSKTRYKRLGTTAGPLTRSHGLQGTEKPKAKEDEAGEQPQEEPEAASEELGKWHEEL